jgi:hypothetical protein
MFRAGGLAAFRVGHGQPGQQGIQLGLFELLAIWAVLGGDPQRPPLIPQKRPVVPQLADPVKLGLRHDHDPVSLSWVPLAPDGEELP